MNTSFFVYFERSTIEAVPFFPTIFLHIFGKWKDIPCLIPCTIDKVIIVIILYMLFNIEAPSFLVRSLGA
jgi:hypothetical protein